MESAGIESSSSSSSVTAASDLLLLKGVGSSSGGGGRRLDADSDSLDSVHLQKMKLAAVDKVLASPSSNHNNSVAAAASPLRPSMCSSSSSNNNNNPNYKQSATEATAEILQIVELSDLLQLDSGNSSKQPVYPNSFAAVDSSRRGGGITAVDDDKIRISHGHPSDFRAEKCDVTPENLKKSDQEEEDDDDDSLLIDLRGSSEAVTSAMTMMQFCDTKTSAAAAVKGDCDSTGVQLTLLDLDEPPPPPPAPEKPQAFTISFGDEARSEEQKQKYEKMFERFQNKRHRRGQSLSKVDVVEAAAAAVGQESQSNSSCSKSGPGGNRLAKTPSSAKLPRKTFSEPSSKANEDQQQQHLDDDAKVKLRDKRNAAMREPSKRHSWSPRTTTTTAAAVNTSAPEPMAPPTAPPPPPQVTKRIEVVQKVPEKKKVEVDDQQKPLQMPLNGKFTAKSSVLAKVLVDTKPATRTVIEGVGRAAVPQVQYQPPPTRPQLPEAPPPLPKTIKQRGFVCEAQPLIDDSKEEVDEELSDAGTYTLDGDNYTEEQKEMMDIDNLRKERQLLNKWEDLMAAQREEEEEEEQQRQREELTFLRCKRPPIQRPTSFEPSLEIIDLELIPTSPKERKALESDLDGPYYGTPARTRPTRSNGRNVLEISCTYEEPSAAAKTKSVPVTKQKVSYLEKIKSKVKNLSASGKSVVNKSSELVREELQSPDIGTFTSVTTSGILSYKPTLEDKPAKFGRRNSLTKTQIQNTEYVQGVSRVVAVTPNPLQIADEDEKIMNSITDSDKLNLLSSSENDDGTSLATSTSTSSALKSAVTKNDWIHEWAKSARKSTTEMSRSFTVDSNVNRLRDDPMSRSECFGQQQEQQPVGEEGGEEYGVNLERNSQKKQQMVKRGTNITEGNFVRAGADVDNPLAQLRYSVRRRYSGTDKGGLAIDTTSAASSSAALAAAASRRPPMSPTKIPSPVHTMRARSMSHNRSHGGSAADLMVANNDTDVYLQNTAAAILTLQSMHLNNSLHNSPSPSHPPSSPRRAMVTSPIHPMSPQRDVGGGGGGYNIIEECQNKMNRIQQLHKRNLSLDGSERDRNRTRYGKQQNTALGRVQRADPQQHTRHHSYEGGAALSSRQQMARGIDQTPAAEDYDVEYQQPTHVARQQHNLRGHGAPQSSPIRRSSSFSAKPGANGGQGVGVAAGHQKVAGRQAVNSIKKSASSTSFKKYHYEDESDIYINDDDDLDPGLMSNESEYSYEVEDGHLQQQQAVAAPITNTRFNKAFMMRMEQNKSKPVSASSASTGAAASAQVGLKQQGVVACPNTPEMSRRGPMLMRQPLRDRQSMPRDSSMNRMKQDSQMSFNSTKKGLKEAPAAVASPQAKIQPKYLDISKYKPQTTGNFLKKDESKSYLVKNATNAAVEGIKRSPSSASVTLTRTDPTRMSNRSVKSAGMRPSQKKEPPAPPKQTKEQELAMWRRRASYDPMKAAMEGKKRQEEAKRQMLAQQQSKLLESPMVLRSQSFHSGATMLRQGDLIDDESTADSHTRWTTESSDEEEDF